MRTRLAATLTLQESSDHCSQRQEPPTPFFNSEPASQLSQLAGSCWSCQPTIQQLCQTVQKLLKFKEYSLSLLAKKEDELLTAFKLLEESERRNDQLIELLEKKQKEISQLVAQAEESTQLGGEEVVRKDNKIIDYLKSREYQLINRIKDLQVELLNNVSRLEHERLKNSRYIADKHFDAKTKSSDSSVFRTEPQKRKGALTPKGQNIQNTSSISQKSEMEPSPDIPLVLREMQDKLDLLMSQQHKLMSQKLNSEQKPAVRQEKYRLHYRHHTEPHGWEE